MKRSAVVIWASLAAQAVWTAAACCEETPSRLPATLVAEGPAPIFLPPVEGSTNEKRLTLAEAEVLATACHPALREAAAQVSAAQGKCVQVGLRPNPTIGYAGDEIGNEGKAGQQGGFVSQEIVTAGKLRLNRDVAQREQQLAEQRLERTRLQVMTTVRRYYIEALVAERQVALATQLHDIAKRSVDVSEQRLKALQAPKTALLQSQIESESAELFEEQASERREAARRRLASIIGATNQRPATLEDVLARPLPDLDFATTRDRLMKESPELAELRLAVERARVAIDRADAARVPNVNLLGGVQHDNASQYTFANVEISVPLPLFDRNQGGITQANGDLAAARAALDARELALDQQLSIAMRDYRTARERVLKYASTVLPAARETLDLINMGYQQGELDYVQVLTVQQTYASKNLSYLQDLETAWNAWAEIDGLLVGDLPQTAVDSSTPNIANAADR